MTRVECLLAALAASLCLTSCRTAPATPPAIFTTQPGFDATALTQSPPQTAATAAPTYDGRSSYKRERDAFAQATLEAQKKRAGTESFQHELEKLSAQKTELERQKRETRRQLNSANDRLKQYTTLGLRDQILKWQSVVDGQQAQLDKLDAESIKAESDLHATIQALQASLQDAEENSLILPGESIHVDVLEDPTLSDVYEVRRGGTIYMKRVGPVFVAGMTLADAAKTIKKTLSETQLVGGGTVVVERPQGGGGGEPFIYLSGEFLKTGPWSPPRGIKPTVVTAFLYSGGTKPSADRTRVRLLRLVDGQAQVEEVNVAAILAGSGLQSDLNLKGGDIIFVPAGANDVYVTGRVLRQGPMKVLADEELTAYTAILRAGGFGRFANRKKVYVDRDLGNGEKKKIPVNIVDVQKGKAADVILLPKDIVVVPEKFFSF